MQFKKKEDMALLAAIVAQVIFGFSFMFTKIALEVADPLLLIAVRFCAAFLVMNILVWTGKLSLRLKGKNIRLLIMLGIFQPVVYFLGETYGIKYSSSSFSGVMIALIPILTMILGMVFLKEKATGVQVVFAALSVGGVILASVGNNSGSFSWIGFVMLMLAVATGAAYTLLGRKISQEFTPTERCYVTFALGCVVFTAMALITSLGDFRTKVLVPLTTPSFWVSIAFLAICSSVMAYMLLNYALTYISAGQTSIMANVTTVISILAGVVFLHEPFTPRQMVASVIILVGVYGVNRAVASQQAEDDGKTEY
ncbi:MAG: DMT family transporter [Firmicutes bacterium]|nr:DMT family transporter [Bacillota bacterium]